MSQVQYDQPIWNQKMAYYTALDLDGSTALTDELLNGYALFADLTTYTYKPSGGTSKNILGLAATRCEDSGDGDNRPYFIGIITNVKPGRTEAGWVWVVGSGDAVTTYVGVNTTTDPLVALGGVTGQWYLGAVSNSGSGVVTAGTGTTAGTVSIPTLGDIARVCALPLETDATLTATPANIKCRVGPLGGVGGP